MSELGSYASASSLPKGILPVKTERNDRALADSLRRCPAGTLEAARRYRMTRGQRELQTILQGVITRYVDSDKRSLLVEPHGNPRLSEDLAIDSLSMIEISITLEDVLEISLPDEILRQFRTLEDIKLYARNCLTA